MSADGNQGWAGQRDFTSGTGLYNILDLILHVFTGGMATATLVQVINVHPGAGLLQGTVDVLPLVNQQDSLGNTVPHEIVYGLPYARLQSGTSAVICDPVGQGNGYPGDIGVAVFASRDISSVKNNKAQSNPGSFRRFDYADGIYLFSGLGLVDPTQYVQLLSNAAGINIVSPGPITVNAGTTATIEAADIVVHASHSYRWDAYGYGVAVTYEGSNVWQIDDYTTAAPGQTVNSNSHDIDPPQIPLP